MQQELRPLSLGEILDRTFQMYRSHFLMFAGISSLAAAIDLVWKLVQTGAARYLAVHTSRLALGLINVGFSLLSLLVYVIAGALALAAMARAVSAVYLGQPTGITIAYSQIKDRWFRYVRLYAAAYFLSWGAAVLVVVAILVGAIALRRTGSTTAIPFLVGFLALSLLAIVPFGIWMMLRYALANAVCVFEDTKIGASLKRSVLLSKGSRGKMFVMFLLVGVLVMVLTYAAATPFIVFLVQHRGQTPPLWGTILTMVAGFVVTSITTPIYGIALTFFYYDARIRKEGFDVDWMMQRAMAGVPAGVPAGAPPFAGQPAFSAASPVAAESPFSTPLGWTEQAEPPPPRPPTDSPFSTPLPASFPAYSTAESSASSDMLTPGVEPNGGPL